MFDSLDLHNENQAIIKLIKDWFWYVLLVEVVKKEQIPVANVSGVVSKISD